MNQFIYDYDSNDIKFIFIKSKISIKVNKIDFFIYVIGINSSSPLIKFII